MVPFWGERHRAYFVDRCLPSLLALNNLPLLSAGDGHRFLIATTRPDWQAIETLAIMDRIRRHVTPTWIEIGVPVSAASKDAREQYNLNLDHMRQCLRSLLDAAYRTKGYGCSLLPDVIVSDGMVAAMLRSARAGNHLMLCSSLRQIEEGVLDDLASYGLLERAGQRSNSAETINLPPRLAADIWVRNLHPEMNRFEEASPDPHDTPPFCIWRVPGGRGIIMHSSFAVPILMDLSIIPSNHLACLEDDVFENVYVTANFSHCTEIDIVRDSDEFVMLSLTPRDVNWSPLPKATISKRGLLSRYKHLKSIRRAFATFVGGKKNRIKYETFRLPFRWHSAEIDEVWRKTERRIERQIWWAVGDYLANGARAEPHAAFSLRRFLLDSPDHYMQVKILSDVASRLMRAIRGDPEMRLWAKTQIRDRWRRLRGK